MANAVDMVIASEAIKQVQNLIEQLTLADAELLKVSQSAINVSKNIAGIKTPSGLDKSTGSTAALTAQLEKQNAVISKVHENLVKKAEQSRLAEIKLQQAREKSIDDFSKKLENQKNLEIKQLRDKISLITSLNKQRYSEEQQQLIDHERAILHAKEAELKQIRAVFELNKSLNSQKEKESTQNAKDQARAVALTTGAYQKLDIAHKQAVRSAQDIGVKYGATSRQFKNAADKANVLDRELKKIDATLGKSQRNVGNYSSAFNGLGSALGAFGIVTGVAGVALLAKSAFETTKDLQSLNMALLAVTGSQEEFSKQQSFLARVAEVYGVEIKGLTSQFTAFYVAANGKIEGKEIQTIFENISKSGAALGVNTETLKRAFVALTQMLSKGKVASEELRRQLAEALPGSVQAMTRAVQILHPELKNLNEEGLFKMIENGKILAEEVLPETSRQLLILVGADKVQGIDTITKSTNRFLNAWTRMVDSINNSDSSGFSLFVKSIVEALTNILDFTGLLFKDENQLTDYFQKLGAAKGVNEYKAILNNISGTTVEQQEITKKALLERERETIRVNQQIVKDEKQKRESILGGNRAFLHLQTKMEEDAIVQIGNSAAIIKAINEEKLASNTKILKTTTALTKEQLSDRAKAEEERLKDLFKLSQAQVELQIELSKKEVDNELNSFDFRYDAFKDFSANRLILLRLNYSEEIRLAKGNKTKLEIAEVDFNKNMVKEKTSLSDILQKIREDENKQNLQEIKQIEADIAKVNDEVVEKNARASKIEQTATKASIDLIDRQIEKLNELKRATDNYLQSFSSEFASNMGFSETFDTFFREIKDVNGNVTTVFEDLLAGSEDSKEKFAVYFNAIAESAQEAFNFIADISQGNFDKEKQRLQDQYDLAIVFAGDSSTAKAKLAEDLERKQKEIANRENKAKQKQALFNIAIDTAQGIVAALKIGVKGIPLAVIIGALGAVQLAVVASQKIPQYAEGTSNHAGGPMIVNDGPGSNFAEKVITPDGKIFSPQGRNVLMNAPKGTKVLNHEQQIHEMLNERGVSMNHTHTSTGMTAQEMDEVMSKHFAKIQTNTTIFDKKGIREYTESNGNRTIRDNNRVLKTGFRV
jgi:tape measure domain-containing protein